MRIRCGERIYSSTFVPLISWPVQTAGVASDLMRTHRLVVALPVVCVSPSLPVFGQSPQGLAPSNYLVKFDALQPGDTLRISLFQRPYLVTGTDRIDLIMNIVVREDGRLTRFAAAMPWIGRSSSTPSTMPVLADISAGGMTISQLQEVLERRIEEPNYETRVTVQFTGSLVQ